MTKPDIIEFVQNPRFLGLSISPAQERLLRGLYGLPLVSQEQRDIWTLCTERPYLVGHQYREVSVLAGARSGKDSRIAAPVVLYEAVFGGIAEKAAKGKSYDKSYGKSYIVCYIERRGACNAQACGVPIRS